MTTSPSSGPGSASARLTSRRSCRRAGTRCTSACCASWCAWTWSWAGAAGGHVVTPAGKEPPAPGRWGRKGRTFGTGESQSVEWLSQGRQVGWVDGDDLYLDPECAFAEAQRLANDQGEALAVTKQTLFKRLKERKVLASTDETRQRYTIRRVLQSARRDVLHLRVDGLQQAPPPGEAKPQQHEDEGAGGRPGGSGARRP